MNKSEPNWHQLSFLPELAEVIDGWLEEAEEALQSFPEKELVPFFEDSTVKQMFDVYGEQRKLLDVYDRQLKIWQESQCQLNQKQATEINRLQKQLVKLKTATDRILKLTERLQEYTIETVSRG